MPVGLSTVAVLTGGVGVTIGARFELLTVNV